MLLSLLTALRFLSYLYLQEERSITGPEPGLTRDAVTARWQAPDGQQLQITDTAGWMRSARLHDFDDVGGDVALKTLRDGYRSLNMVHVVVIMVDASLAVREDRVLSTKEMTLAGIAIEEGKAVVMAPSKMDLLSEEQKQVRTWRASRMRAHACVRVRAYVRACLHAFVHVSLSDGGSYGRHGSCRQ